MPLGIDATIRYATRNWSEPLKQSELTIDSPYNTRRRTGLPPTPIGSPGLASIKAAANPAERRLPLLRGQAGGERRAQLLVDRRGVPDGRRGLQPRARARAAASRPTTAERRARRFGVLGWPVAHSRSPRCTTPPTRRSASTAGATSACPVPPELFAETVRALPAAGLRRRERDDPAQGGGARARRRGDRRRRARSARRTR